MEYAEWFTEARPVLDYIKRRQDESPYEGIDLINPEDWANASAEAGIDEQRLYLNLERLVADGSLEARIEAVGLGVSPIVFGIRLLPSGLRELGIWPRRDVAPDVLLELLQTMVDAARPEDRPAIQRLREAAVSVGRDVLVQIISGLANYAMGRAIGS